MIYTEDIHKKIMMIHNPNKKWQNFLTNFGAASVITFFIMFLASLFPPIEVPEIIEEDREYEKNKFEEYKARHGFLELDLKKEKNKIND